MNAYGSATSPLGRLWQPQGEAETQVPRGSGPCQGDRSALASAAGLVASAHGTFNAANPLSPGTHQAPGPGLALTLPCCPHNSLPGGKQDLDGSRTRPSSVAWPREGPPQLPHLQSHILLRSFPDPFCHPPGPSHRHLSPGPTSPLSWPDGSLPEEASGSSLPCSPATPSNSGRDVFQTLSSSRPFPGQTSRGFSVHFGEKPTRFFSCRICLPCSCRSCKLT